MAKPATATARPNFGALLDKAPTEIERPKPLPAGTYTCVVQGLPEYDKSSKKQTEYVRFTLKPLAAEADVDTEALAEMGGLGDKTIPVTFYITENSLFRLKDFLSHLGFDVTDPEASLREMCETTTGRQVRAFIKHRASEDGESIFAEVGRTASVED